MKLLVLGVDGLGEESLRGLGLNRLAALINQGQRANPEPDNVVSRGWPEIYSGVSAYESGAFFQIPVLSKGRIVPTQKTGADVVSDHVGAQALLWTRLHAMGYRVGVFGLPTVSHPQPGCEFTFPATGAGSFSNSTESMGVYPKEFARLARYSQANHGLRIGHSAFLPKNASDLDGWLRDHLSQYFFTLRQTLRHSDVDALVLGTRFVTLFYKFRHILSEQATDSTDVALKETILQAADDFDFEMSKFISDISPRDLFVVSDHGLGELKYHVNINELLRRVGYIHYPFIVSRNGRLLVRRLKDTVKGVNRPYFSSYDLSSSKAFSIGYTDVIYINDSRFTGPEMSSEQRFNQAASLAEILSAYVAANDLSQFIAFKPLRNAGKTAPLTANASSIPLPDIRCFLAPGCVNLGRTHGKVVEANQPSSAAEMFDKGFFSEHSGIKTSDALAAYIGPSEERFQPGKLTELYDAVLRVAERY
ncbi:MAG: hypothetical protein WEB57_09790 [Pseudohongiellaceae bacterium]